MEKLPNSLAKTEEAERAFKPCSIQEKRLQKGVMRVGGGGGGQNCRF